MSATPTQSAARLEKDGAVATIVMDRPEAMNSQDAASRRDLVGALRTIARDDEVRAVVLTGEGKAFCAGQDLREEGALDDVAATIRDGYVPLIRGITDLPKPVIAAINGAAAGAGMSIALACDIRVMAEDAVLMMAFSNIALVPDSGGSWFLARAVGYARALEIAITGRRVTAEEALALGIVQQVVPRDEVRSTAAALAATFAARPPLAVGWTKRIMQRAMTTTLEETIELETQLQRAAVASDDHREGVQAFLEKRAPSFRGR